MKKELFSLGQLVGKCTYVEDTISKGGHRYAIFNCSVCSNAFTARISHVKAGSIYNCGCVHPQEHHGKSDTRLYEIWEAMKQRCLNPDCPLYINYGAKDVSIQPSWYSFSNFEIWALSSGYSEELTIDRIDAAGNYCETNCRWACRNTQAANKRFDTPPLSGFTGVEVTQSGTFQARVRYKGVRHSVGTFPTALEAAIARDQLIIDLGLPNKLTIFKRDT